MKVRRKTNSEPSPSERRKLLSADVEAYLKMGNKIDLIPSGVSSQDPQGRGKPLSRTKKR